VGDDVHKPIARNQPTMQTMPMWCVQPGLDIGLHSSLEAARQWESDASGRVRCGALAALRLAVSDWVVDTLPAGADATSAASLLVFGSCRMLGVVDAETDVDCVLVTTSRIARAAFFASFVPRLAAHSGVTHLNAVPAAFVPIVKFRMHGVHFDLITAVLPLPSLIGVNFLSDECLIGMDDASVRSLNGVRVAEILLQLVPDVQRFRCALRAVRLWAKRRGVYSNVLGYLGGINCAILVARVAQMHPAAPASQLVAHFFRLYSQWKWEAAGWNPVELVPARRPMVNALRRHANWGEDSRDQMHAMPIITPAFPHMNSAFNVGPSSLATLQRELRRGAHVSAQIESGHELKWEALFEPSDFFDGFGRFLRVRISATTPEAQQRWFGWVETRLRGFVRELEAVPRVARARLLTTPFEEAASVAGREQQASSASAASASASALVEGFATSFFIGLRCSSSRSGGGSRSSSKGPLDLSLPWSTFASQVAAWGDRDSQTMDLELRAFARSDVPLRYRLALRGEEVRSSVSCGDDANAEEKSVVGESAAAVATVATAAAPLPKLNAWGRVGHAPAAAAVAWSENRAWQQRVKD
tara:strand:- start:1086 stop:2846 length:1761 start_codon:yes stop_codon:yes gene_type:complete